MSFFFVSFFISFWTFGPSIKVTFHCFIKYSKALNTSWLLKFVNCTRSYLVVWYLNFSSWKFLFTTKSPSACESWVFEHMVLFDWIELGMQLQGQVGNISCTMEYIDLDQSWVVWDIWYVEIAMHIFGSYSCQCFTCLQVM